MSQDNDQLFAKQNNDQVTPSQQDALDQQKQYLEELVGEGKKFKTPEDLARGKLESDNFIERLKNENAQLRSELDSRLAVESFVEKVQQTVQPQKQPTETPPINQSLGQDNQSAVTGTPEGTNVTPEKMQELVEAAVSRRLTEAQRDQNIASVEAVARRELGENYKSILTQKATELGLGPEFLSQIARENPKAFLNVMGLQKQTTQGNNATQNNNVVPNSQSMNRVTPDASNVSGGEKTYSYYEKLRTDNPSLYFSPRVQNEMHNALATMGDDAFYK